MAINSPCLSSPTLPSPVCCRVRMRRAFRRAWPDLLAEGETVHIVTDSTMKVAALPQKYLGAFRTADEIQRRLQRWIAGFVNTAGSGLGESAARYPLRDARVEVRERPGRPGVFACTVLLQPHYQLDAVGAASARHHLILPAWPGDRHHPAPCPIWSSR